MRLIKLKIMTTLVIGQSGQLARALKRRLPAAVCLGRDALDLSHDAEVIRQSLDTALSANTYIDGIILAAAYTAVDNAETDGVTANAVNGYAPGIIAAYCAARNLPLVHVSTDYVFNGTGKQPYKPTDPTAPTNAYGRSKRQGELAVLESKATAAILRTSWVYDGTGKNFLTTMLRLAESRDTLGVVADQVGRPTYAVDLADACLAALKGLKDDASAAGIYHVSNSGDAISWADFASAIFAAAGKDMTVNGIATREYPTPATRPAWSLMDISDFEDRFDHALPEWSDGMARALTEHADAATTV